MLNVRGEGSLPLLMIIIMIISTVDAIIETGDLVGELDRRMMRMMMMAMAITIISGCRRRRRGGGG